MVEDFIIIEVNYSLKSAEFIPPFKFLEFNKKFGNIRKNIKIKYKF